MSEEKSQPATKKLLEKSPLSGIAVPIAIVLVGALIIFGVTRMLSSGKNHRDLVTELNSKTFGNRWVAAYELSKYLASARIPESDVPWVVENLVQVYDQSVDARTRNFIVKALGLLQHPLSVELFNKAVNDENPEVRFSAIVSLGNLPVDSKIDWANLEKILVSESDEGLKQAVILTVATHRRENGAQLLRPFLSAQQKMLRYSAAMGMIYYAPMEAEPVLKEILALGYQNVTPGELNGAQVEAMKLNVLTHIQKAGTKQLISLVQDLVEKDSNIGVSTKAQELVNLLKN
jgi:HEAT repeat protein